MDKPQPPPEAALIERARKAHVPKIGGREAARRSGISDGRWRQIVNGYQSLSAGVYAPVRAPAETLARMARVVGVTAEQMEAAGRPDVAQLLVPHVGEREIGGGWTVRTAEEDLDDPEILSFAEELLESALRLARTRQQSRESGPKG